MEGNFKYSNYNIDYAIERASELSIKNDSFSGMSSQTVTGDCVMYGFFFIIIFYL